MQRYILRDFTFAVLKTNANFISKDIQPHHMGKGLREMLRTGEFIVFASGLIGLGLQILAGRILAPEFGSSVFTWGSIIGIFMVALTLGYYVGGRYAQGARKTTLSTIMLISILWVTFLAFFSVYLAKAFSLIPLPPQYSALPAVAILFGPVTFLFGMLTPYAVQVSHKRKKGAASGHIFTLDTLGSIIGSFGVTFILIPLTSITTSLVILGLIGVVSVLMLHKNILHNAIAVGLAVLLLIAGSAQLNDVPPTIIHQTNSEGQDDPLVSLLSEQTLYQKLDVFDQGDVRYLYLDNHPQSAMNLSDNTTHVFTYTPFVHIPLLIHEDIERALFIGGGGFTNPKEFVQMGINVTVVELDGGVVEAAVQYFNVDDSAMDIYVVDGRHFLQNTKETYDLIVVDAYRKDKVPFHMATTEFYTLVNERLNDEGIVFSNFIAFPEGKQGEFFRTMHKTTAQAFPSVYAFRSKDPNVFQNMLIMATKQPSSWSEEQLLTRATEYEFLDIIDEVDYYITDVDTSDVEALYDGKAPVDTLLARIIGEEDLVE